MAYDKKQFLSGLAMGLTGKGNPTFEGSGKMLYNGVELPELPEWDKVAYPYACIAKISGNYRAIFSQTILVHNATVNVTNVKSPNLRYELSNGEWVALSETGAFTIPGKQTWTSYDILNEDGTVFLAASEPVPVEDAFTKGYHVGAALRRKRRLPVAYLYNGVRLPKLPQWDRVALIRYDYVNYHLYIGSHYVYRIDDGSYEYGVPAGSMKYRLVNGEWVEHETFTADCWIGDVGSNFYNKWTNTDVLYDDGTVGFAASDPVPVYE